MQVINPFNRVPETEESLALACRCQCSTGSATNLTYGSTDGDYCGCQCDGGYQNKTANDTDAYMIANGHYQ